MPARKHESFPEPSDPNAKIWRYMDLPKLLSFLFTSSLYLSRLGDLGDPFEGRLPSHALGPINERYAREELAAGRRVEGTVRYAEAMGEWVRAAAYVNCWCCQTHESEALWRLYGHPAGVALTTTFSRLRDALPESLYFGRVRYLDYQKDAPPTNNFFNLATHKRNFFSHEQEVRVMGSVVPLHLSIARTPDTSPAYMTQPVPFSAFDGLVISPFSQRFFRDTVADLLRRYDCRIPVSSSNMALE